jgi:hypothetical protein
MCDLKLADVPSCSLGFPGVSSHLKGMMLAGLAEDCCSPDSKLLQQLLPHPPLSSSSLSEMHGHKLSTRNFAAAGATRSM